MAVLGRQLHTEPVIHITITGKQMLKPILALAIAIAAVITCGCEPEKKPKRKPRLANTTIVVVSSDGCRWCNKQMDTIGDMKSNGDLGGVAVRYVNHSRSEKAREDYPADSYPTIYIFRGADYQKLVGYQSRTQILSALE